MSRVKKNKIPTMMFKSEYWKLLKVIARIPTRERIHKKYMNAVKSLLMVFASPFFR